MMPELSKDNYTIEVSLASLRGADLLSLCRGEKLGVALGQPHYQPLSPSSHGFYI